MMIRKDLQNQTNARIPPVLPPPLVVLLAVANVISTAVSGVWEDLIDMGMAKSHHPYQL
jgi:hypothetical protein